MMGLKKERHHTLGVEDAYRTVYMQWRLNWLVMS
jgi:hypothetical protein